MTPQRVNLITLGVDDLDRSKAFYAALGWEPAQEQPGVVFYRMNGAALGLFGKGPLAEDQGQPGATLGTATTTPAKNFQDRPGLDAAHAPPLPAGDPERQPSVAVLLVAYSGYHAAPTRAGSGSDATP